MRLVLTGPAPCELVDAKICLTFRIFVKLPSGSMFCSTQDLELVRPEVNQGIPNNLFDFVYFTAGCMGGFLDGLVFWAVLSSCKFLVCILNPDYGTLQVSYLRYGLMVRHIIDRKSPVYGHTMESLIEGDASFSLTVMGLERTSMQPIFHLEVSSIANTDGSLFSQVGYWNT